LVFLFVWLSILMGFFCVFFCFPCGRFSGWHITHGHTSTYCVVSRTFKYVQAIYKCYISAVTYECSPQTLWNTHIKWRIFYCKKRAGFGRLLIIIRSWVTVREVWKIQTKLTWCACIQVLNRDGNSF
jgi:hypothetical protein